MMGPAVGQQDRLFYEFNLDDRVPANHLLRRIAGLVGRPAHFRSTPESRHSRCDFRYGV